MRFFRQTLLLVCLLLPCALLAQPIAADDAFSTSEDTNTTFDLVANDTDLIFGINAATVDLDVSTPLVVDNTFANPDGTYSVDPLGVVTFTPALNFNGPATLSYTVKNNAVIPLTSPAANINITVTAVNDAPTIAILPPLGILEDTPSGPISFAVGDVDSPVASLTMSGTSSITTLVDNADISFGGAGASRTINIVPLSNQNGLTTITMQVSDGTLTAQSTFVLTVTAVNDPPVLSALTNISTNQNVTSAATAFSVSDIDTPIASIDVTGTSSVPGLIDNTGILLVEGIGGNWTVAVTPVLNQTGSSTITLIATDGALTDTDNFLATVIPANTNPTISDITDQNILEDFPTGILPLTVNDAETPGTISVSGLSSNVAIVKSTSIVITGTGTSRSVVVTPEPNANGSVTITLTASDGSGGSASSDFVLAISSVNDDPLIGSIGTQSIVANTSTPTIPFTVSDIETGAGLLVVSAASSNPTIVPVAGIVLGGAAGSRTVVVTPAAGQFGSVLVTLTVTDANGGSAQSAFTVNISAPANTNPTITGIAAQSTAEDVATLPIGFTVNDAETPGTISVSGTSSNQTIVPNGDILVSGSGTSRTVVITPALNQFGLVTITLNVSDGNGGSATTSFPLTITSVNDNPAIAVLGNLTTSEDIATVPMTFTIGDIETPPGALTLSATSSNGTLLPVPNIAFGGGGASRTFVLTPAPNQFGSSNIVITVSDGTNTASSPFVFTVDPINDPPSVATIGTQNINEDNQTGILTFNIGDLETAAGSLNVTAQSSNTTLVPGGGIVLGGSGTNRTIRVTPALNQFGSTTMTVHVSDGLLTTDATFVVNVQGIDDVPTITPIATQNINENSQTGLLSFSIDDVETLPAALTLIHLSSNPALIDNTDVVLGGSGGARNVNVFPKLNQSGSAVITLTVSDGVNSAQTNFLVNVSAVDSPPTFGPVGNINIAEDTPSVPMAFTVNDLDSPIGTLVVTGVSGNPALVTNANISLVNVSPGNWTVAVTPTANAFGTSTITLTVTDDLMETATTNLVVTVSAVNDNPTITAGANQTTAEDTPTAPQTFTLTDIDTPVGNLVITGTSTNLPLVPNVNIVEGGSGATRTVVVTPTADQSGVTTINLGVSDGAGGAAATSYTVTVTPANDPPTITSIVNQNITEDQSGGTGLLGFTVDDIEGSAITVTRTSTNTTLAPVANVVLGGSGSSRTVRVTPVANEFGTTTITLIASDGALSATTSFDVIVSAVNDLPTISTIGPQTIDEGTSTGALPFNIGDIETDPTTLTVTRSSSNTTLLPLANVVLGGSGPNRTVTVTPAAGENGTSTITLTVNDGTGGTASSNFLLTVTSVDNPPTITAIGPQSTNEDAASGAIAFTIGDPDTSIPTLTLAGTSSNATLVPNTNIVFGGSGTTRNVVITPAPNLNGTTDITINVSDGNTIVPTVFTLTVVSVNDAPTISAIGGQTTDEDIATGDIAFSIGDIETPAASLSVVAVSDNTTLFPVAGIELGGAGASRTIKLTPAANLSGTANITITIGDGTTSVNRTFLVTVNPVNDPPTVTAIADQIIVEDTPTGALAFTIGDVEGASLVVTRSSSNTTLIPTANVVLSGSGTNRFVNVTPALNRTGTATITITVDDGTNTTTRDFLVTVTPVDDPPAITAIANRTINEDEPTGNISFTVSDPETPATDLIVTAVSSDLTIVSAAGITLGGTTGARTIAIQPVANMSGTVTITVTVSDNVNTASRNFTLNILPINDLPVVQGQSVLTINESEPLNLLLAQLTVFDPDNTPAQLTLVVTGNANYFLSGPTTITPVATFNGVLDVPVYVQDPSGLGPVYHLTVTVNSTNDAPTITANSSLSTNEDQDITLQTSNFTITDPDTPLPNINLVVADGTNYTHSGNTVTPALNYNGPIFVNVRAYDGASYSNNYPTQITVNPVNDPPSISAQSSLSTPEENALLLTTGNFTITDPENGAFTLTVSTPAPGASYTVSGNTITPVADFNGMLTVPVTVSDGFLNSLPYNAQVNVTPVNDAPVITNHGSLTIVEDDPITLTLGDLTVSDIDNLNYPTGFTLNILPGSNYTFAGTIVTPTLDFNGDLQVNVQVSDGSTVNALSAPFVVHVNVTNDEDAPVITGGFPVSLLEDGSKDILKSDITVTDQDTPPAQLILSVLAGTNYMVSGNTITPAANFFGTLSVNVRIFDGVAYSNTWPLQVTVTPVNDPPSFNAIANVNILEDASTQTITITGISAGPLEPAAGMRFTFSSDNTSLIKMVTEVTPYNGSANSNVITFKPEPDVSGVANIAVTLIDGDQFIPKIFVINVASVNDAPTIAAITLDPIPEDSPEQLYTLTGITPGGGAAEIGQALTVTSSTDNQIADVRVEYTGGTTATLRVTPKPNANGAINISVRVQDDGAQTAPSVYFVTRTIALAITPINDEPVFTSQAPGEAIPGTLYVYEVHVTDNDGDPVTITAPSLPPWLTLTQISNGNATITGTPPTDAKGDFSIALSASDPTNTSVDGTFSFFVNTAPTLTNLAFSIQEDNVKTFALADFAPGFHDNDGNPLEKLLINGLPQQGQLLKGDNTPVIPGEQFTTSEISGLRYVPRANYNGRDTIYWNGSDGRVFAAIDARVVITMTPANDAPRIIAIEDEVQDTLKYELGSERPVPLTSSFEAVDDDGDDIMSAEIGFKRIDNYQYRPLNDLLIFVNTLKITGTFEGGSLTLRGRATAAEYVLAIRSIKYNYIDARELLLDLRAVSITLSDGLLPSEPRSRIIELIYSFEDLDIPTAFSPNGDDKNPTWLISSPGESDVTNLYDEAVVRVYNKQGLLLYQAKGFDSPWDGNYKGSPLPTDTYFYTIDLNYNRVRYKGTVTLLR